MVADAEILKLFALLLVRFSGLVLTAPVLGSNNFPVMGKVGLVGLSAMIVTPSIAALDTPLSSSPLEFGIMAIGDLLIGMLLGLIMRLMFAAIPIGGPITGAMMIAYVTMGIMGRVVPQIHMFVIGFPITISLSLFVVAFATTFYIGFIDGMLGRMWRNVKTVIAAIS